MNAMMNELSSSNCTAPNVIAFIYAHQPDANTLGKQLTVPAAYILGLSGWETRWGDNRFAIEGTTSSRCMEARMLLSPQAL